MVTLKICNLRLFRSYKFWSKYSLCTHILFVLEDAHVWLEVVDVPLERSAEGNFGSETFIKVCLALLELRQPVRQHVVVGLEHLHLVRLRFGLELVVHSHLLPEHANRLLESFQRLSLHGHLMRRLVQHQSVLVLLAQFRFQIPVRLHQLPSDLRNIK